MSITKLHLKAFGTVVGVFRRLFKRSKRRNRISRIIIMQVLIKHEFSEEKIIIYIL